MSTLDFKDAPVAAVFDLTPEAAVEFFKAKGLKTTYAWQDMIAEEHAVAFTVAKMLDSDLLAEVRAAVDKAISEGVSRQAFRKELEQLLQTKGWWGKQPLADPLTGMVSEAQLGSAHRLYTIYRNNLRSAYAVGHWQKIQENKSSAPYLMYDAVDDHRTRPEHAAWDNTVLPADHPWWQTHYPPNGWNCRCGVIQLSQAELEAMGLKVSKAPPTQYEKWTNPRTGKTYEIPKGIDPGWHSNPGIARLQQLKQLAAEKIQAMPADLAKAAAEGAQNATAAAAAKNAEQAAQVEKAAQAKIRAALEANTPYLSAAIKQVQKTKAGQNMTPSELLAAATEKAAKAEQSAALAHYKQAALAGKEPSAKAKAAFAALAPDDQAKISQQIAAQGKVQAAQEAIEQISSGQAKVTQQKALKQLQASGKADELGPVELLAEVDKLAAEIQAKASASAAVSGYKKKAIAGKMPTPAQVKAFNELDEAKKAKILDEIEQAKQAAAPPPPPATTTAPEAPAPATVAASSAPNPKNLTQIGPQRGSNPGGLYRDTETGIEWYVKQPPSADIARNEVLAAKLYEAAGIDVPELHLIEMGGQPSVASRIVDGLTRGTAARLAKAEGVGEGFVVDAWLGNWDVVGLNFDNLLLKGKRAVRVDTGGALRYRAQGGLKPSSRWTDEVQELDTLRDASINPQAAQVFGNISREQLIAGARKVVAITDDEIRDLVTRYGPTKATERDALIARLIARRDDIARRFPEARQTPRAEPAPAAGRVTETEAKIIRDARQNGYAIPTDKDQIEDQQILFWHEKAKNGKPRTHAQLKVRGEAIKALERAAFAGAEDLKGDLDDKVLAAIKGIATHSDKDGLRPKDIDRLHAAYDTFIEATNRAYQAVARGHLKQEALDAFEAAYNPWMKYFRSLMGKEVGQKFKWQPPVSVFQPGPALALETGQTAFKFTQKTGQAFVRKRIERGFAAETDEGLNAPQHTYYETEIDGVTVRFWPEKNGYWALANRVEIIAPGDDASAAARVMAAIEKLGINADRPSPLDAEELYLTQIAYHRRDDWARLQVRLRNAPDQAARIEVLADHIKEITGQDPRKSPVYNPHGSYQAFGHGYRHLYRPDLHGAEWQRFTKDYRLYHQHTGSGDMPEVIDRILGSGGKMAATTDKLRRGIPMGGMSPELDLETGGAEYFFTRIKSAKTKDPGFYWKADHLARLDSISYDHDMYGRTTGNTVLQHRKSTIAEWRQAARSPSNETIFKGGLSLFDALDKIVANSEKERQAIIAVLRKHGYEQWPDGRELDEVIVTK